MQYRIKDDAMVNFLRIATKMSPREHRQLIQEVADRAETASMAQTTKNEHKRHLIFSF